MTETRAPAISKILSDPADRTLARSILGTDDAAAIAARVDGHCRAVLGAGVALVDLVEFSVGASFGLVLADGRRVFLKAWSPATPLALLRDVHVAQAFLAARGYPCPGVLAEPRPFGDGHAVLIDYLDEGDHADANSPAVRRAMAAAMARLVALATPLRDDLPALPRGRVPRDALWPVPHNALFDFGATRRGAEWIDRLAAASRDVLLAADVPAVIGHRDWSAKNMRFGRGGEVSAVYDWDSLAVQPEAVLVGSAAVTFPVTWYIEVRKFPPPEVAAAFVRDYETARGRRFGAAERAILAAAASYRLSYTARCEHALDPAAEPALDSARRMLRAYVPDALADLLAAG